MNIERVQKYLDLLPLVFVPWWIFLGWMVEVNQDFLVSFYAYVFIFSVVFSASIYRIVNTPEEMREFEKIRVKTETDVSVSETLDVESEETSHRLTA